jgi:large subunit ribosomal protein L32e
MPPKFLRRNWDKFSRLGRNKRKKQVWRSPKGRHNKMRLKRKGYPATVNIGYKQEDKKKIILVNNLSELENIAKGEKIIFSKVGNKKKIEMMKKAKEKGIQVSNINEKKFEKKIEMMKKAKKAEGKNETQHEKKQENKK